MGLVTCREDVYGETIPSLGGAVIYEKAFSASFLGVDPPDREAMFKGPSKQKPGREITQKRSVASVLSLVVHRYLVHRNYMYSSALVLLLLYEYHSTPGTEITSLNFYKGLIGNGCLFKIMYP